MSTENENNHDNEDFGEYLLTKTVKSSRRTYFFDVRATKGEDYFVTITESRKRTRPVTLLRQAQDNSLQGRYKTFLPGIGFDRRLHPATQTGLSGMPRDGSDKRAKLRRGCRAIVPHRTLIATRPCCRAPKATRYNRDITIVLQKCIFGEISTPKGIFIISLSQSIFHMHEYRKKTI